MGSTKYFTESVEISVGLDEWEDDELIKEIKSRGYKVDEEKELIEIEQRWNRGEKKEALILLERKFPELIGISKLLD